MNDSDQLPTDSEIIVGTFEEGILNNAPIFNIADSKYYNGATFDGFVERPRKQFNVGSNWFLTLGSRARVVIVGHTDSDGADAANLDLSRRRAAAVKTALTTQFGIAEGRMETDGKGESEPVDKNDTPAGKANNRRVEFIRK